MPSVREDQAHLTTISAKSGESMVQLRQMLALESIALSLISIDEKTQGESK